MSQRGAHLRHVRRGIFFLSSHFLLQKKRLLCLSEMKYVPLVHQERREGNFYKSSEMSITKYILLFSPRQTLGSLSLLPAHCAPKNLPLTTHCLLSAHKNHSHIFKGGIKAIAAKAHIIERAEPACDHAIIL